MKEVATTRVSLTKDERAIAKTYGHDWAKMLKEHRKHGTVHVLIGDWSGYRSSQYRYTHVQFISRGSMKHYGITAEWRERHGFGDNTSMSMWIKEMSIEHILNQNLKCIHGYDNLIWEYIRKEADNAQSEDGK